LNVGTPFLAIGSVILDAAEYKQMVVNIEGFPSTFAERRIAVRMNKVQFEAELIEGHKGVNVVLVPFDPEERWSRKPVRLEGRRHGWLVVGSANGVGFDGYIGERWNRFFIIIDSGLRDAANVAVGDTLRMSVEPTSSARVLARALKQSKVTTAPKTPRRDAIDPSRSVF